MISMLLIERLLAASIETTAAAAIVLAVSTIALRRAPRIVALLWLAVLAKPLLSLMGASLVHVPLPQDIGSFQRHVAVRAETTKVLTRSGPVAHEQTQTTMDDPARMLAMIWLAGAALLLGRTLYHRLRLRAIVAHTRAASPRVLAACARIGVPFPAIRVSDALDGPAIGGAFRPVILIPAWMDERGDDAQLEWALRHELRHATAHDTLAIALRELALIAFWFHPLVWLAAAKWEAATELACDRDVISSDLEAVDYADALYRTLLNVRQQRRLQLASGLFATRSKIGTRIAALVERPLAPRIGRAGVAAAALIGMAVIATGAGLSHKSRGRHRGEIEETQDGSSYSMRYDAVLGLDDDRIRSLSPGGFVELRETAAGTTRELRLEGTPRGIIRTYRVNGRAAPPDESFERRMTARLRRLSTSIIR